MIWMRRREKSVQSEQEFDLMLSCSISTVANSCCCFCQQILSDRQAVVCLENFRRPLHKMRQHFCAFLTDVCLKQELCKTVHSVNFSLFKASRLKLEFWKLELRLLSSDSTKAL